MSGPVFVLDAQGTPLMPMSSAHARALVARGAAHWILRPPFTILQLTRIIPAPVLHPVIIGVCISACIAELFVVSTSLNTARPLLYITIDLQYAQNHNSVARDAATMRISGRLRHPLRLAGSPWVASPVARSAPCRQARIITQTIMAVEQFIPLSHLVMLPSHIDASRFIYTTPGHEDTTCCRSLSPFLIALQELGLPVVALSSVGAETGLLSAVPLLGATLNAFCTYPTRYAPCRIAVPTVHPHPSTSAIIPGMGATARIGNQWVSGLAISTPGRLARRWLLRVPVAVESTGVRWHRLPLDASVHLQPIPVGAVTFLPLSPLRSTPSDQKVNYVH